MDDSKNMENYKKHEEYLNDIIKMLENLGFDVERKYRPVEGAWILSITRNSLNDFLLRK